MAGEAAAIVEELTQRRVVGYLTAQDDDPDLAILIFYLARHEPTASLRPGCGQTGPEERSTYAAAPLEAAGDLVLLRRAWMLRGGFTRVEQTLREGGHGEDVIRQRMAFQEVMRERFTQVVEEATGPKVIGFMSGNQQDPDMICEVFVLAQNTLLFD